MRAQLFFIVTGIASVHTCAASMCSGKNAAALNPNEVARGEVTRNIATASGQTADVSEKLHSLWRCRINQEMTSEAHAAQLRFRALMHPRLVLNDGDKDSFRSRQLSPLLSEGNVADLIGCLQRIVLGYCIHASHAAMRVIKEARFVTRFRATVSIQEAIIRALAAACGVEFVAIDSTVLRRLQCEASSLEEKLVTCDAVIASLMRATETKPSIIWIRDVKILKSASMTSIVTEQLLRRDCFRRLILLATPHVIAHRVARQSRGIPAHGARASAAISANSGSDKADPQRSSKQKRSTAFEPRELDDKARISNEVDWFAATDSTAETFQQALREIVSRILAQAPTIAAGTHQEYIRALLEALDDDQMLSVICDGWLPVLQDAHAKVQVCLAARRTGVTVAPRRISALQSAIQRKATQRQKQKMEATRLQESVPQALVEWMRSTAVNVRANARETIPRSNACYEDDTSTRVSGGGERTRSNAENLLSSHLEDIIVDEPPNSEARAEFGIWFLDETLRSSRAWNTARLTTHLRKGRLTGEHGAFGSLWRCGGDLKNHLANSELSDDQIRQVTLTAINLELTQRHQHANRLRLCQYRQSKRFRRETCRDSTAHSYDQDRDHSRDDVRLHTAASDARKSRAWFGVDDSLSAAPLAVTASSLEAALIEVFDPAKRQTSRTDVSGASPQPATVSYDKHERLLVAHVVTPSDVSVSYDSIGGLDAAKDALRQTITYPLKYPHLYSSGVAAEAVKGVLLFGPPGTGKTLLAKAVATEGGASFLSIDASAIENKWLGESEKNAKAVFSLARKLAPCVIFLDEIDSLLSSREHGDDTSHGTLTSVKTTLMQEWDGLRTTSDRVIVIGSTNRPYDLDEAVLRRMPRRILVDLPDAVTREQILRVTLRSSDLAPDVNLTAIAQRLHGYSGSDVKEVCREAVVRVANAQAAKLERRPSNLASSSEHRLLFSEQKDEDDCHLRPVTQADFDAAISKLTSSVAEHSPEMSRIREWNEMYGEVGKERHQSEAHGFLYL